ncbi:MAG TPA: 5-formyltetrahydrofolate cyclo-ligase, partial [Rhodospirillales bacterium]|nr:5-formyltetrahydrofolate cyclo-ligase [Rhodospirillales bacterium]
MNSADLKADLRLEARSLRRRTHAEFGQSAAQDFIDHGLAAVSHVWNARPAVVAGYLAVGSELDAGPLMAALAGGGWSLALPVVVGPETALIFRRWQQGDAMGEGSFGIAQPLDSAPQVRPDLVLAPLLAFDELGYRLGQGGGFYDRTLANWRHRGPMVPVLGLAFAAQQVASVPRDQFDQRLSGMITESG